jgi:DeoR/GlpR family transcriptional regulator of sugar metabolism
LEPLVPLEVRAGLNPRQLRFLSLLRERGQMSRKDYELALEVSERTANNDLQLLVRKGLIGAMGSSVRTVYVLKNK